MNISARYKLFFTSIDNFKKKHYIYAFETFILSPQKTHTSQIFPNFQSELAGKRKESRKEKEEKKKSYASDMSVSK